MRTDENGVQHPLGTEEVTVEGLKHIQHCEECQYNFPWMASLLEGVTE